MEQASGLKRFAWICLILAVVACCGVIIIWRTCCRPCPPCPDCMDGDPVVGEIIIENSEIASWTTINNYVDPGNPPASVRHGVLIQAGVYDSVSGQHLQCKAIEFLDAGQNLIKATPCSPLSDFYWIDVVSSTGPMPTPPIQPSDAVNLAPVGKDETCCGSLDTCLQSGPHSICPNFPDPGKCPTDVTLDCLRGRKLHSGLKVMSMLTYWRGNTAASGYSVQTSVVTETLNIGGNQVNVHLDKYVFSLPETFGVKLYKCDFNNQVCTLKLDETLSSVHTIAFRSEKVGNTEVGLHTTPPWPTKKP